MKRFVVAAAVLLMVTTQASAQRAVTRQIGGSDVDVITGTETWPHVTQSETQIAVNGQTVVVAYNDSKDVASSPLNLLGISVSTIGGAGFTRLSPSPFASGHGSVYGDPFVVHNPKLGEWFAGGIAQSCGSFGLGLWTSANGTAWAPGACAHNGSGDDNRPSLAVDSTPASPFYGRMYLSYNDFGGSGTTGELFVTHSDDGVTWTSPTQLTTSFIRGLRVAVAPDGTVLEGAMDELGGGFHPRQNQMYRSTNGGVSFSGPILQGGQYPAPGDSLSGSFTKFNPIWRNGGTGDLVVGSNGVAIFTYVAHGTGDSGNIMVARSTNYGQTWAAPVRIDGDPGTASQWMPSISGGDSRFLVAWYDRRNSTNGVNYERWGTISTDGGLTWGAPQRISDILIPQPEQPDPNVQSEYAGDYGRDIFVGNTFYDAWTDGRVPLTDPNSGGQHFQQDVYFDKIVVQPTAVGVSSFRRLGRHR